MKKVGLYIRKLLYLLAVLLLITLLVVLNGKHALEVVDGIEVEIDSEPDKQLISESRVRDLIQLWYPGGLVGLELRDININDIEKRLNLESPIRNAEVSTQLNGKINIEIEQRVPLIRIFTPDGFNFYLDKEGVRIPTAGLEPARVLVATQVQTDTMIKKVYTVSTYVHENAFMKALSEQIFVNNQGDIIIIPKIHRQQIILGDTSDLLDKFARLEAFYRDGMKNFGGEKYKTINLKFKDQVVCN